MSQFESLRASSLYCQKCSRAMPLRESLLLVLPDKEIYDYLCTGCSSSLGHREVSAGDLMMEQVAMRKRSGRTPSSLGYLRFMRVLFAGTGDIGIPTLRFLAGHHTLIGVLTQPDRPAGRHRELKPPPIKEELLRIAPGVPLLQPESPRLPEAMAWVCDLAPEVMVTMAYGRIIPPRLLVAPSLACLNIHASLLPRHRGASPIQAAIASGDSESGVTIMHMAEGLDTGDILLEKRIPLRRRETAGTLSDRLSELAPVALEEALLLLAEGKSPRIVQDHAAATVTGKIGREESLLEWSLPAIELERKIRSLQPRPAAVAVLRTAVGTPLTLKIHSAIVSRRAKRIPGSSPGNILRIDARGILVACGEGALLLGIIQPEGGGRMHSSAFARGRSLLLAG